MSVFQTVCLSARLPACLSVCPFVFGPSSKLWQSKNFALKNKSKLFIRALFPQINVLIICMCFCICQLLSMGQELPPPPVSFPLFLLLWKVSVNPDVANFSQRFVYVFSLPKWLEIWAKIDTTRGQLGAVSVAYLHHTHTHTRRQTLICQVESNLIYLNNCLTICRNKRNFRIGLTESLDRDFFS